jgi:hypothetical protein
VHARCILKKARWGRRRRRRKLGEILDDQEKGRARENLPFMLSTHTPSWLRVETPLAGIQKGS